MEIKFGIAVQLYSSDFKVEVQKFIDQNQVKAIIMGNRRTDPYSQNLDYICPSSPGWPVFTRVFPILDWNYLNVWQYLKSYDLEYCKLYDLGYTSLGEIHNSVKNPFLKIEGTEDEFQPAYILKSDDQERFSRSK
jgi:3'-phosphoadenosine 5'-phosphosulfate sulfotransferase (PAPS reductase)/FAD synthetase